MAEEQIKLIILCSWGATSSQLAKKVQQAAEARGINLVVDAGGTGEFNQKASQYHAVLLEPQVRHMKKEVTKTAEKYNTPVELVDQMAFALMDGNKVLDQVLSMLNK
ncbi:PTS sugar transporter subunit IIB [Calidifontibacillus erzurumensis]|uniref:PTS sugar transporter subunit IIB n=1 Tax=Calidifontibacillus erzurumensis TaxID=2741433 RepID=A0A8J8KEV4_9BACI|nr:PTS sugar transporter subunit IIB [Calidifontibacillus erzurumensis]NSL52210.1 PTS sugar transporter subunit IIB [Calidifontibacillus erzurumensis]